MRPYEAMNATSCNFVHKRLIGAATGFITGGPGGAARGFFTATDRKQAKAQQALIRTEANPRARERSIRSLGILPEHTEHHLHGHHHTRFPGHAKGGIPTRGRYAGMTIAQAHASLTGGGPCNPPLTIPDGMGGCRSTSEGVLTPAEQSLGITGQAVAGAFGMPAMQPASEMRQRLSCPPGMVLGRDDLCYPKQVLRRDSKFRKWRPGVRPILTGGQRRAISKARSAITTARDAISGLGVTVKKN